MRQRIRWMEALSALVVLAAACNTAEAQVKPFRATGAGLADWIPIPVEMGGRGPAFHFAEGTGTHLGRYRAEGVVRIDEFTGPLTARFSSAVPVVFTAADGSELHLHYAGNVELIPLGGATFISVWDAEFTPVVGSSTGRFARVVGGRIRFIATTEPFELADLDIGYRWEGDGFLEFARP